MTKTLIVTDSHHEDPADFIRGMRDNEGVERLVHLGDIEEPGILRGILDLDISKIVTVGNHEQSYCFDDELTSKQMRMPFQDYVDLWNGTSEQKYVLESSRIMKGVRRGAKVIRRVGKRRIVYIHGALSDECVYPDEFLATWGRLEYKGEHKILRRLRVLRNFYEMNEQNYWTMFRGHDHFPGIFSIDKKGPMRGFSEIEEASEGRTLGGDMMHIVSVGPFFDGHYAVFDDKTMKVELKRR